MTDAYANADVSVNPQSYSPYKDGDGKTLPVAYSKELDLLAKIDRFGVRAVMGRNTLYYGETRRMILAENIYNAYHARRRSENWAEWAEKNPAMAKILFELEKE